MRKTLLFAAALAAIVACQKEVEPVQQTPDTPETPEVQVKKVAPKTLTATFEANPVTRAGFTYDASAKTYSHFWEEGDDLAVYPYDDVYDRFVISDVSNGTFNLDREASGTASNTYDYIYAVYPYEGVNAWQDIDHEVYPNMIDQTGKLLVYSLMSPRLTEPYGYGNVMVARSEDSNLNFKNLVGWLKISLKGDVSIRSLNINTFGQDISGPVYVEFDSTGEPVITRGTVDMVDYYNIDFVNAGLEPVKLSNNSPTDFYFPILPGTLNGFSIFVYTVELGEVEFATERTVTIERNKVTPMAVREIFEPKAVLMSGSNVNQQLKFLSGNSVAGTTTMDYNIKAVVLDTHSSVSTGTEVQASTSEAKIYANWDAGTGTITLSTSSGQIYANPNSQNLFKFLTVLEEVDMDGLNISEVTDASYMFQSCYKLQSMGDVSLPLATTAAYMFMNCSALESVGDVSLPLVTTAAQMFYECNDLGSIGEISIPSIQNTLSMFSGCSKLTSVTFSSMGNNLSRATTMFSGCSKLQSVTGLQSSNMSYMKSMFYDCPALATLDLTNISGTIQEPFDNLLRNCLSLESIAFSDDLDVTGLSLFQSTNTYMFPRTMVSGRQPILKTITLGGLANAPALTSTAQLFGSLPNLETIVGTLTVGDGLTDTSNMFGDCASLKNVDLSGLKGNLTKINLMFNACGSLTSISLPAGFNTSAVASDSNSGYVFNGCSKLETLIIPGFFLNAGASYPYAVSSVGALLPGDSKCQVYYTSTTDFQDLPTVFGTPSDAKVEYIPITE